MAFLIGDLVESPECFSGIGKVVSLDEIVGTAQVAFFESPIRFESRKIDVDLQYVQPAVIFDETIVFLLDDASGVWRRARYASQRPNGKHLIIFSKDDTAVVSIAEVYVPNLVQGAGLNPIEFLAARCCDTPLFTEWRLPFVRSYIEQRAACKSISSILSSSVEIEPHQIAVVRRILEDETKKYLLADEVGLGKTVEACLIVREHVLQDEANALVIIAVPRGLVDQWRAELTERFYLGDLLGNQIFVCPHDKLLGAVGMATPTMIVIDEAHLIAPWAWSELENQSSAFEQIASSSAAAHCCLLLSGTPLTGNETNFLAMLHILAPESYPLNEAGIQSFKQRVTERERLGGMYQALVPSNDNDSLMDIVEKISSLFPDDAKLQSLVEGIRPLIAWTAPEIGDDRIKILGQLRTYLGETYRLHQRLLRNRREDPEIAGLFPGLAGATLLRWEVDARSLSIDQILDAYRDEYIGDTGDTHAITSAELVEWFELYLTSPILVSKRAESLLASNKQLLPQERELLQELLHRGRVEQQAKDEKLVEFLSQWLNLAPKRKAVVFCGDVEQADSVYQILQSLMKDCVERHNPESTPAFQQNPEITVLICDSRGEDGLNLHGGEKLIVHYGVPLSITRIEQRNGRVNRYSASIHAKAVASTVLVPNRTSFFFEWVALLDEAVEIFDRSVASLQYVLQEQLDNVLRRVAVAGLEPLREQKFVLMGKDGLLERERHRVSAQEQLNSMNEEVERAKAFAEALRAADGEAEAQSQKMVRWICKGLQFARTPGEVAGSFRFRFSNGEKAPRTLVDVRSFIERCITGIDKQESDWSSPVTALMSPDRELVTHGRQVYPMRFGQPFVDTIFSLSRTDPRGITSAWLRAAAEPRVKAPEAYFELTWFMDSCSEGSGRREQRLADERMAPKIYTHWVNDKGEPVEQPWLLELLVAQYSTSKSRSKQGVHYQDVRIRHDTWQSLEEYFPKAEWPTLVRRVTDASREAAAIAVGQKTPTEVSPIYFHPEAISAVILLGTLN